MGFSNLKHVDVLKIIAENTTDIILFVENNGIVSYVTPSIKKTMGYDESEFLGKTAFNHIHVDDQALVENLHKEVVNSKSSILCDYRAYHRNGSVVFMEAKAMPVPDEDGEITLAVVVLRDITDRKQTEIALRKSEQRYKVLQSSLNHFSGDLTKIMKSADLERRLLLEVMEVMDAQAARIFHISKETNTVVAEAGSGVLADYQIISKLQNDISIGTLLNIRNQYFVKIGETIDRSFFLGFTLLTPQISEDDRLWLETIIHYVRILYDNLQQIEQLIEQLQAIAETKETPVWVLRLLFNLSEKERFQLSGDLHDSVLQTLIHWYRKLENMSEPTEPSGVTEDLVQISEGLLDCIHQIRNICNEVRPPFFRETGIIEVLRNLFDHVTQFNGNFEISFQSEENDYELNEEQMLGIYRIVQELLNNTMKHSDASLVRFHIRKEKEDYMAIEYSDNGKGFELERLKAPLRHLGISGIQKRVQSLEGSVQFSSSLDCGVSVKIKIPVKLSRMVAAFID
ncbi:DNA phosphorothioation-dependent restriction protein DptG [Paenibacillus thermotolerans]|uniref:DNA phosphorothioation-dependent restriction protein DptG n=1 Tax=Paenibacillus thermotolerans TaxID=3027807 RepID=UPI002368595F|nr:MULTISPECIES: DNA phosphorothioation-dependent restriction protein DptG [unclassified Paenibacillus]